MENEIVTSIAKKHEKTPAQVLLRFLIQKDIVVIPKSTNAQRLTNNFQVLIKYTKEFMYLKNQYYGSY